jgi:predicted NBD/HSP70 family sugar kinase
VDNPVPFELRSSPAGKSSLRQHNLSLALRYLAGAGPTSRAVLASATGLGRATISSLVDELLTLGLVEEQGPSNLGRVGRPGTILALSKTGPCGIGLEINVNYLEVCVLDVAGEQRYREVRPRDNRGESPKAVVRRAATLVRGAVDAAAGLGLDPVELGVAIPGIVEYDSGLVRRAPNLGWENVSLGRLLRDELEPLSLPVTVDNGANLAALAELHYGQGRQRENFVLISGEFGIGAGIVLDGALFRGTGSAAGEVGHVPVSSRGPACSCGGRGCLESFAGQEAIFQAAGLETGIATPQRDPESAVAALVERARSGDRKTVAALARTGGYLGTGIGILANVLAPEAIILSGIFGPLSEWLMAPLAATLQRTTSLTNGPQLKVLVSSLGPEAAATGAASLGVIRAIDNPRSGSYDQAQRQAVADPT